MANSYYLKVYEKNDFHVSCVRENIALSYFHGGETSATFRRGQENAVFCGGIATFDLASSVLLYFFGYVCL